MSQSTLSEDLVVKFFAAHGVRCTPVPTQADQRTPDFVIELAEPVVCEVKQIEPNTEDLATLHGAMAGAPRAVGRWMRNRIRPILKKVSAQLQRASKDGKPTLLAIYDTTPFELYASDDVEVVQAMFGQLSTDVRVYKNGTIQESETYFGGDGTMTPTTNTSVSAVGILRGGPEVSTLSLTIFHNRYARVELKPSLFDGLPVVHKK